MLDSKRQLVVLMLRVLSINKKSLIIIRNGAHAKSGISNWNPSTGSLTEIFEIHNGNWKVEMEVHPSLASVNTHFTSTHQKTCPYKDL